MGEETSQMQGILAFITTDKNRFLGGDPLALVAKDEEESREITVALSKALMADVLQLNTGDYVVIKK